jgi:hypothetical protein
LNLACEVACDVWYIFPGFYCHWNWYESSYRFACVSCRLTLYSMILTFDRRGPVTSGQRRQRSIWMACIFLELITAYSLAGPINFYLRLTSTYVLLVSEFVDWPCTIHLGNDHRLPHTNRARSGYLWARPWAIPCANWM